MSSSSDLPPCQYCGRQFLDSNAGAREQHVEACRAKHNGMTLAEREERQTEHETDAPGQPARRGGQPPTTPATMEEPQSAGAALADLGLSLMDPDVSTDHRRQMVNEGGGMLSGAVNRVLDYRERKAALQEARAEQASLTDAEAAEPCGTEDCDYEFGKEELQDDQVSCPECGKTWDVVVEEA